MRVFGVYVYSVHKACYMNSESETNM